jgi:hypothetical protein
MESRASARPPKNRPVSTLAVTFSPYRICSAEILPGPPGRPAREGTAAGLSPLIS